jgi:hypothetical protein
LTIAHLPGKTNPFEPLPEWHRRPAAELVQAFIDAVKDGAGDGRFEGHVLAYGIWSGTAISQPEMAHDFGFVVIADDLKVVRNATQEAQAKASNTVNPLSGRQYSTEWTVVEPRVLEAKKLSDGELRKLCGAVWLFARDIAEFTELLREKAGVW